MKKLILAVALFISVFLIPISKNALLCFLTGSTTSGFIKSATTIVPEVLWLSQFGHMNSAQLRLIARKERRRERMEFVNMTEVLGIWVNDPTRCGRVVKCIKCATQEELDGVLEDDLISVSNVELGEQTYFCDECKKRL
jgi:hypothetical protein